MRNILLTISYDGTDFCGWQRQDWGEVKNYQRTVQGEIEKALEKFIKNRLFFMDLGAQTAEFMQWGRLQILSQLLIPFL